MHIWIQTIRVTIEVQDFGVVFSVITHTKREIIKETEAYSLKFAVKDKKKSIWGWACWSLYEITWYRVSASGPWKMPVLDQHHKTSANSKSQSQSGLLLAPSIKLSQNKKQNPIHILCSCIFHHTQILSPFRNKYQLLKLLIRYCVIGEDTHE